MHIELHKLTACLFGPGVIEILGQFQPLIIIIVNRLKT